MTTHHLTRTQLTDELQNDLERFRRLITSLNDEEQQTPFTPEDWSIKDFLAHMSHWKAVAHALIVAYLHDQPLPPVTPSGDDANEKDRQLNNTQSLPQVRTYWEEIHTRLQHLVADDLNDQKIDEVVRAPWSNEEQLTICNLIADMCDHDAEHFELIEQYFEVEQI